METETQGQIPGWEGAGPAQLGTAPNCPHGPPAPPEAGREPLWAWPVPRFGRVGAVLLQTQFTLGPCQIGGVLRDAKQKGTVGVAQFG